LHQITSSEKNESYFSKIAKQELDDAVLYYELEYQGLGKRFKEEVRKSTIRISEYSEAWSIERGEIRKCTLHKINIPKFL
jgi:hypothetical protein